MPPSVTLQLHRSLMEELCAEAVREYQRSLFCSITPCSASSSDDSTSCSNFLNSLLQSQHQWLPSNSIFPVCEQPKPQHSYIGLIAMAILSSPEKKMVLSEVYEWIMRHYSYFRSRGSGWRNSIRHNLSLNDCFVKAGRAANGKGHYWAVHPACVRDFEKGDYRRRRAQRKVRRHMGLTVTEEDSSDESCLSSPVPFGHFPVGIVPFLSNPRQPIKDFSIDFLLRDNQLTSFQNS